MKLIRISLLAATAFVLMATSAMAQSPSDDSYGPSTNLPMTGMDLALLVGGGLALLLVGLVLRRAVSSNQA